MQSTLDWSEKSNSIDFCDDEPFDKIVRENKIGVRGLWSSECLPRSLLMPTRELVEDGSCRPARRSLQYRVLATNKNNKELKKNIPRAVLGPS